MVSGLAAFNPQVALECGTDEELTIDCVYPWSRGGTEHPSNFETLCRSCNSKKGARLGWVPQ